MKTDTPNPKQPTKLRNNGNFYFCNPKNSY